MYFCQALNFSLTTTSGVSFSLDNRKKAASPDALVKPLHPNRRNAKRKEEYLKRKQNHLTVNPIVEEGELLPNVPSCDQCDFKSVFEKGLRQHKRMKHGLSQLSQKFPAFSDYACIPHLDMHPGERSELFLIIFSSFFISIKGMCILLRYGSGLKEPLRLFSFAKTCQSAQTSGCVFTPLYTHHPFCPSVLNGLIVVFLH